MPELPKPGDNHGILLRKIVENTFAGSGGGVGPQGPPGATGPAGSNIAGIVSTADQDMVWLTASETVGIGVAVPDGKLHVLSGDTGGTAHATANVIVAETTAVTGGIGILAPATSIARLAFGSPVNAIVGGVDYNLAANSMSFRINNAQLVHINFAGNVGIGIGGAVSADGKLHVHSASAGAVTANTNANELVLENNGSCGLSILSPNDSVGIIYFGDPDNNAVSQIAYNHSFDILTFQAAGVNILDVRNNSVEPNLNNVTTLGSSAKRWTEVFATAGTINTSDIREKQNLEPVTVEEALALVTTVVPTKFEWIDTSLPGGTHYGFIAQQVEQALVAGSFDVENFAPLHHDAVADTYGLRAAQLLPILWRVCQDLIARVEQLENP